MNEMLSLLALAKVGKGGAGGSQKEEYLVWLSVEGSNECTIYCYDLHNKNDEGKTITIEEMCKLQSEYKIKEYIFENYSILPCEYLYRPPEERIEDAEYCFVEFVFMRYPFNNYGYVVRLSFRGTEFTMTEYQFALSEYQD